MVRELLINSNEIEEDSRLGMLGEIAEQCEEIGETISCALSGVWMRRCRYFAVMMKRRIWLISASG